MCISHGDHAMCTRCIIEFSHAQAPAGRLKFGMCTQILGSYHAWLFAVIAFD